MGLPKLAPYSGHSTFFTKCWPEKENPYRCHFLAQVKVKNLTLYHVNEFVIWKLIIRNKEEMKLELGITIPKLTVSKKNLHSTLILHLMQLGGLESLEDL